MKTSPYFLEDKPLQILFLDNDEKDARHFFNNGLGTTWFDYDLHIVTSEKEAARFIDRKETAINARTGRPLDLLLISNRCWPLGGQQLVSRVRSHDRLHSLPIYCVASCLKKQNSAEPQCWNTSWRRDTNCNEDARIAATPFTACLNETHETRLDGIICANNLEQEISSIHDQMTRYWFSG